MQASDYIKLLNCTSRFINYGKHNILSIFEWEQTHLLKQTNRQAVLLKSYKNWNGIENKIVSGTGVDLDIGDCEEKIRFFDISQTSEPKYNRKAKKDIESILKEELTEMPSTDPVEIGFFYKHRCLLLTALWMELSLFQKEYEDLCRNQDKGGEYQPSGDILNHVSVLYVIHSLYISNWQDENEIKLVFNVFKININTPDAFVKTHLLGAFFRNYFKRL